MLESLTEAQKKALIEIKKKKNPTAAVLKRSAKISDEERELLIQEGLVKEIPAVGRKKARYELTEKGLEVVKELEPLIQAKKKTRSRSAPTKAARAEEIRMIVEPYFNQLNEKLDQILLVLTNFTGQQNTTNLSQGTKKELTLDEFTENLKKKYDEINKIERRGGRVTIPSLRKALPGISRETFDSYLFELEKRQIIDLQTASDPNIVPSPELGIKHPIRGLIYYLIWRN